MTSHLRRCDVICDVSILSTLVPMLYYTKSSYVYCVGIKIYHFVASIAFALLIPRVNFVFTFFCTVYSSLYLTSFFDGYSLVGG
jgi:hypothetical protein